MPGRMVFARPLPEGDRTGRIGIIELDGALEPLSPRSPTWAVGQEAGRLGRLGKTVARSISEGQLPERLCVVRLGRPRLFPEGQPSPGVARARERNTQKTEVVGHHFFRANPLVHRHCRGIKTEANRCPGQQPQCGRVAAR